MPIFAAVPVQRLETAKSRLASILSAEERRHLVLQLLDNVLAAVEGSNAVDGTIVVSPDPDVLQCVRNSNVIAVEQHGSGLNAAIRLGRDHARTLNSDAFLVILADLPRLTSSEIDRLVEIFQRVSCDSRPGSSRTRDELDDPAPAGRNRTCFWGQ